MRNIFCHEHYFDFRSVGELMKEALHFFNSREIIWKILHFYWNNAVIKNLFGEENKKTKKNKKKPVLK